ncbi:peroxide stress protein YaaA [Alteromonas facilis]|uniref:peroxide stress protein YaaA n=1 Tax=Alteromonas facilis TaxID=2048004 RepID=UPI000C283F04|nr:peroxide stress protein YaaA [Alteromonas facilis]
MLVVLSPAKNLDLDPTSYSLPETQPSLMSRTQDLVKVCKQQSPADLASLMKISDKLAILNAERFNSFDVPFTKSNAKPAVFTFNGDVYTGLDAATLSESALAFGQKHLRILSGLYGVLRPMDLMQAYRLEMGTALKTPAGKNLYEFWGSDITDEINKQLADIDSEVLINLASNEYFKAVKSKQLSVPVITPVFKDFKNGQYKVISFFAKKARGLMARYILENQITNAADLKHFNVDGYAYDDALSTSSDWVFTRKQ